jgi:hypothetical protein
MTRDQWFDDLPVIGRLPPEEAAARLRAVGETAAADAIDEVVRAPGRTAAFRGGPSDWWPFRDRAWQHTGHSIGYLPPGGPEAGDLRELRLAANIEPDVTLRNGRIRITLDRLHVADYPGGGMHRVLFDFYGQNQALGAVEHLHFNSVFRVQEGEQAAVIGYPIFVGLNVGNDGVAFRCFTVNVKNDRDEAFVGFLESSVFKAGLKLVTTAQPAIAPMSEMACNLTRAIASRNRNIPVQDLYLGLDFSSVATGARLAEGSYIAVQIPLQLVPAWSWADWRFDATSGQFVRHDDRRAILPFNFVVFGVSRYRE